MRVVAMLLLLATLTFRDPGLLKFSTSRVDPSRVGSTLVKHRREPAMLLERLQPEGGVAQEQTATNQARLIIGPDL
jgi:hypothetical protein